MMADFLRFGGQAGASVPYYRRAIEIEPNEYPSLYLKLAAMQLTAGHDLDSAIATLQSCQKNCRLHPDTKQADKLLEQIRSLKTSKP